MKALRAGSSAAELVPTSSSSSTSESTFSYSNSNSGESDCSLPSADSKVPPPATQSLAEIRKLHMLQTAMAPTLSLSGLCSNLESTLASTFQPEMNLRLYEVSEGVPKPEEKHLRLLLSTGGDLRFYGEVAPFSFLNECRALFAETLGISKFTIVPLEEFVVTERKFSHQFTRLPLPSRELCNTVIEVFKENINDTFYVFDMDHFEKMVVDPIYDEDIPRRENSYCLFNLVLAIGALYIEFSNDMDSKKLGILKSSEYFDCAQNIMRNVCYDEKLWIAEAHYLQHFYYLSNSQRSSSWLHLGNTIRIAQALGLHRKHVNERCGDVSISAHRRRLWKSIFICDRIASFNLGRPLTISDYDWDDSESLTEKEFLSKEESIRRDCQTALCGISKINGNIVQNIYRSGSIDVKRAKLLALESRLWSNSLDDDLKITPEFEALLQDPTHPNNYNIVLVHLSQFYGLMTLGRPFLIYAVSRKLNPSAFRSCDFNDDALLLNFSKISIKVALLVIKLLKSFHEHNKKRKEVFSSTSVCFNAALILGLSLLYQKALQASDANYVAVLTSSIGDARDILLDSARFDLVAKCWAQNIELLQEALSQDLPENHDHEIYLGGSGEEAEEEIEFDEISTSIFERPQLELLGSSDDEDVLMDLGTQLSYMPSATLGTSCLKDLVVLSTNNCLDAFKYEYQGDYLVLGGGD